MFKLSWVSGHKNDRLLSIEVECKYLENKEDLKDFELIIVVNNCQLIWWPFQLLMTAHFLRIKYWDFTDIPDGETAA